MRSRKSYQCQKGDRGRRAASGLDRQGCGPSGGTRHRAIERKEESEPSRMVAAPPLLSRFTTSLLLHLLARLSILNTCPSPAWFVGLPCLSRKPAIFQCEAGSGILSRDYPVKHMGTMEHQDLPMQSPFAISHEDVEALSNSKAFCLLRNYLSTSAEYVHLSLFSLVSPRFLSQVPITQHSFAPSSSQHLR